MKRNFPFILIVLFITAFPLSQAQACDCVPGKIESAVQLTEAIVLGTFMEGDKRWELSEANKTAPTLFYTGRLVITKVLKGKGINVGDTLQVISDHTNCSTLYKNKANYLLFASVIDKKIKTTICSPSGIVDEESIKNILKQTRHLLKSSY
jgi:hypothetical protein